MSQSQLYIAFLVGVISYSEYQAMFPYCEEGEE
jgi:hypothetical protein